MLMHCTSSCKARLKIISHQVQNTFSSLQTECKQERSWTKWSPEKLVKFSSDFIVAY